MASTYVIPGIFFFLTVSWTSSWISISLGVKVDSLVADWLTLVSQFGLNN